MSQNPTAESAAPPPLNPLLEEALGCLDVQIEEELARYRKTRSHQPHRDRANPQITYPQPPSPGVAVLPFFNRESETTSQTQESTEQTIDNQIADFTLESTSEEVSVAKGNSGEETEAPQEYLASSEQLLRNVATAEEEQPAKEKTGSLHRFLTPLGVGSALILAAAIALLGTALLYPDLLTRLAGKEENNDISKTASSPATPEVSPPEPSPSATLNLTGPNLATDEFAPVNPDSLSTVETNPTPTISPALPTPNIAASPTPATLPPPQTASDLTTALLSPNLSQSNLPQSDQSPARAVPSPTPTPESTPNPPQTADPVLESAPAAPSRGDRFYYVVVDYAGSVSLQQARAIVPEAYVRNFPQGAQIQMGAFSRERDASILMTRLDKQGIKATIYRRE
ncbi:MAG: hypothetical protein J7647_02480 [Cyanobacteria bacterium SBLK]|nr:hypothetical protein [Cyanobacteria bacterium SBLK]